jgi:hypothetical protein
LLSRSARNAPPALTNNLISYASSTTTRKTTHMKNRIPASCIAALLLLVLACGQIERATPAIHRLATPTKSAPTETALPAPVAVPSDTPAPATQTPAPAVATPGEASAPPVNTPACECSADTYNCGDALAQVCFKFCQSAGAGDVHNLDGDGDGIACQGD